MSSRELTIDSLSKQIRALRGDLSQAAFAKKVNKPQAIISRLENYKDAPNIGTLLDIADKLGLVLSIRFGEEPLLDRIIERIIYEEIEEVKINGKRFVRCNEYSGDKEK